MVFPRPERRLKRSAGDGPDGVEDAARGPPPGPAALDPSAGVHERFRLPVVSFRHARGAHSPNGVAIEGAVRAVAGD